MTEEIIIDGVNVAGCQHLKECKDVKNPRCLLFDEKCHRIGEKEEYEDICYYKQLQRLKQENEKLRGTDGNIHPDSAYYKIKKLEIENEELKQANKKMYQSMHKEICEYDEELGIEKASHESDLETLDTYRSALEEIREIVQRPYNIPKGEMLSKYVIDKINEVLSND